MRTSPAIPAGMATGLGLIAIFWPLAWLQPDGFVFLWENSFFPLWLGYILVVDGCCLTLGGTSLLRRNKAAFAGLFLLSVPGWWLFEFFNSFLHNWHYLHNRFVPPAEYALRSSICFSTVFPAVFETAELLSHLPLLRRFQRMPVAAIQPALQARLVLAGVILLVLTLALPRYFFPAVWIALVFIIDPLNHLQGRPSLIAFLAQGNRRPLLTLPLAALVCGFFWEMWNFHSLPRWFYTVPFVDFGHLFAMPLLGYLGYLPFGLEVFALYQLFRALLPTCAIKGGDHYLAC